MTDVKPATDEQIAEWMETYKFVVSRTQFGATVARLKQEQRLNTTTGKEWADLHGTIEEQKAEITRLREALEGHLDNWEQQIQNAIEQEMSSHTLKMVVAVYDACAKDVRAALDRSEALEGPKRVDPPQGKGAEEIGASAPGSTTRRGI